MGNAPRKLHHPKNVFSTAGTKKVHWEGSGLPAPPGKPILIPGTEETQPDVVGIRWERSPNNGGSAIIGYLVEHRKLGSPHWIRSVPFLCTFPEMTLSGLEPGWRYQFRIRAQNSLGLSEPSEISDPLVVTLQRVAASPPHFNLELKDTIALENEQAEFKVQFEGVPNPEISWFKDGFEIFSSRRTRIITENGKSTLLIHRTALDDEGEIKCTATNRAGHVSTKARLILEAPPRIRLPRQYEDGLLFEQDETIRLKVSLAGRPTPDVIWYHDGEVISDNDRYIRELSNGESTLKISEANRKDRGEYSVRAINKLGEDITSFLVTVTDRPSAPGKATVVMTLGRSVTLTWKEPEDDGGCKIGMYIVEYYRVGWDMWLKAATCRQTSTTLSELIEGSEYRFRIKAENPYGVSDPSEESEAVFIPDLKRGIVGPLGGKSQSQREIHRGRSEKKEVTFMEWTQRTRSLTREEVYFRERVERSSSSNRYGFLQKPTKTDSKVRFDIDTVYSTMESDVFDDSGGQSSLLGLRSRAISSSQEKPSAPPKPPRIHDPKSQISGTLKDHSHLSPPRSLQTSPIQISQSHSSPPVNHPIPAQRDQLSPPKSLQASPTLMSQSHFNPPRIFQTSPTPAQWDQLSSPKSLQASSTAASRSHFSPPRSSPTPTEQTRPNPPRNLQTCPVPAERSHSIPPENRHSVPFERNRNINSPTREDSVTAEQKRMMFSRSEPASFKDDEINGSSEFMLVLYPDGEKNEDYQGLINNSSSNTHKRQQIGESNTQSYVPEFEEDLVPPPISLSLPELFSTNHQFVEIMREAVSSSELLYELAMERFYRAIAAERAVNLESNDRGERKENAKRYALFEQRSSYRRKLSNTGILSASWQVRRDRRKSSDGQSSTLHVPFRLPTTLQSTSSVPNLSSRDIPGMNFEHWTFEDGSDPLRRWHETGIELSSENMNNRIRLNGGNAEDTGENNDNTQIANDGKLEDSSVARSVETSVETSGEESSDDDLRQFRARLMAIPIVNEEETYNPRGRSILRSTSETPPPIPPHAIPLLNVTPTVPDRIHQSTQSPPMSPTNIVPKSILKKRAEPEIVPINQFVRPVPPEKSIEVTTRLPEDQVNITRRRSLMNLNNLPSKVVLSDFDVDNENLISAAEAAKNRRRQSKQLFTSINVSSDDNVEKEDEKMAVVSHYTEIVKEYSMGHNAFPPRRVATPTSNKNDNFIKSNPLDSGMSKGIQKTAAARTFSPPRIKFEYISDDALDQESSFRSSELSGVRSQKEEERKSRSRRNSVSSRSSTPAKTSGDSKKLSRPSSRHESPVSKSRNVSSDRGISSRSSSRNRKSLDSDDRYSRKSMERSTVNHKSSRPSSRSSSRDRFRVDTMTEEKLVRLLRALEDKKQRSGKNSVHERDYANSSDLIINLEIEAKKNVRSTVSYVTDVILLLAAVYVYLFKREILAIPIIGLLLYRQIQHGIRYFIPKWLRGPKP